jgi:Mn2+/Fe2+ NRAMP family transporter
MSAPPATPEVPRTLGEYLRSFGPGIVVVLTWLGAGDVVDMAVAGSSYGYSLMWVLVVAVFIRFVFVSAIARYQLCNPHGEGVTDGLCRVHPAYAPLLFLAAVVMSHVYQSYMTVGAGEVCRNLFGRGETWQWAIAVNASALLLVVRPAYARLELAFRCSSRSWRSPSSAPRSGSASIPGACCAARPLRMPGLHGRFDPLLVALAMIGAVGARS